jgi:hypothetical protein
MGLFPDARRLDLDPGPIHGAPLGIADRPAERHVGSQRDRGELPGTAGPARFQSERVRFRPREARLLLEILSRYSASRVCSASPPGKAAKRATPAAPKKKPLTRDELNQHRPSPAAAKTGRSLLASPRVHRRTRYSRLPSASGQPRFGPFDFGITPARPVQIADLDGNGEPELLVLSATLLAFSAGRGHLRWASPLNPANANQSTPPEEHRVYAEALSGKDGQLLWCPPQRRCLPARIP